MRSADYMSDAAIMANRPLIEVLKRALAREQEKIAEAEREIHRLKLELLELGVELPLGE